MKLLGRNSKFKIILLFLTGLILFTPFYMYTSHDVSRLNKEYPHIVLNDQDDPDFILKEAKPKDWVKLSEISTYGKWAIIFSEDWAFYQHQGVDVEQVKVALNEMVEGDRFRGASTISQQMIKNVFLSNSRTLWRKLHEYILTFKAERTIKKQRILEIYLNCIEFGPGIYGIKKASYHYFKKHPSALTPRESAFLAMLLPSPKRYSESFKKKKLTDFAQLRIKAVLKKLRMGKVITDEQYEQEVSSRFNWEPQDPVTELAKESPNDFEESSEFSDDITE